VPFLRRFFERIPGNVASYQAHEQPTVQVHRRVHAQQQKGVIENREGGGAELCETRGASNTD
jgi:hypothetical protein